MAEHTQPPRPRRVGGESTSGPPVAESRRSGTSASAGDAAAKQDAGSITWPSTAELKARQNRKRMSLRLDHDMLEWFKEQGHGYQTRMNDVLRAYAERARADAGKKQP